MPIEAIASQRLFERVADEIVRLVKAEEFRVGDRLPPERDLAKQLRVSRPVVREAMIALELAGLVEVRTGAGTYVKSVVRRPVRLATQGPSAFELLAARRLVEGEVAALAVATATDADLAQMRRLNEEIRRETETGRTGVEADRQFHHALAQSTRNSVLTDLVVHLWEGMSGPVLNRLHDLTNRPRKHRTNIADHEAIVAAIERRDGDAARRAMATHIGHVEAVFVADESEAPVAPPSKALAEAG